MSRKVKYGIIGTGAIARMHAQALAGVEQAELFMVFDTVVELGEGICGTASLPLCRHFGGITAVRSRGSHHCHTQRTAWAMRHTGCQSRKTCAL